MSESAVTHGPAGGPDPVPRLGLGSRLTSLLSPRIVVALLALAAIGISGLFGGLADKPAGATPTAAVGQRVVSTSWAVTIDQARISGELRPARLADARNHFIVVVATVEVLSKAPQKGISDSLLSPGPLRLVGVPGLVDSSGKPTTGPAVPGYAVLTRDASLVSEINPNLPDEIAFFWEQAAGSDLPATVTVQIMDRFPEFHLTDHRTSDNINPVVEAEVTLMATDVRASQAATG